MKTVGLILFWLLMVLGLAAQNQMPLTITLANYIPNSYFGYQMATLDFNNDGHRKSGFIFTIPVIAVFALIVASPFSRDKE